TQVALQGRARRPPARVAPQAHVGGYPARAGRGCDAAVSHAHSSLIPLALVALSACGEAQEAPPYREVAVDVQLEVAVAEISERFVSFSVDSAQAFGGKFWSASGEASLVGDGAAGAGVAAHRRLGSRRGCPTSITEFRS